MKVAAPSEKSGKSSPVVSFILLERYNAVKLVQSVHQSLAALSKVIRGTQLLTNEVQNLAAALLNQEVNQYTFLVEGNKRAYKFMFMQLHTSLCLWNCCKSYEIFKEFCVASCFYLCRMFYQFFYLGIAMFSSLLFIFIYFI